MSKVKKWNTDKLKVKIFETREEMGNHAADDVSQTIKELLMKKDIINIIFAAAPSQNEFLSTLSAKEGIDWSRINAFHMDEYVGLRSNASQRFGQFLKERIFDKVPFNKVYYINGEAEDPALEGQRYAELLSQFPADIVCMGIGENTHIAFNDPHEADFHDPLMVKEVNLDEVSRQQQVHDGCFPSIDEVPVSAITLTVPTLLDAKNIFCMVPGNNKAQAIYHTLNDEVNEKYPSTILRNHENAVLYLDKESASML
jgi:glucosamine-6-phosphate deaminase